jgi:glutamate synthase domain-containing protein 1
VRNQHRRRRRHPDPDAAQVFRRNRREGRAASALPDAGEYGVGMVFLPRNANERPPQGRGVSSNSIVHPRASAFLGWRTVPDKQHHSATPRRPASRSCGSASSAAIRAHRRHGVRAQALRHPQARLHTIRTSTLAGADFWYVASLSYKTLVYKGMLMPTQVDAYFPT